MGESLLIRKGGGGGGLEITETLENIKVQPGKTVQAGEFVNIAPFKYAYFPDFVDAGNIFARSFPLDKINSNKIIVLFRDSANSNRLTAQIIDITGGTLTKGNKFQVDPFPPTSYGDTYDIKVLTETTALVVNANQVDTVRRMEGVVLSFTDNTINSVGARHQIQANTVNHYTHIKIELFSSTNAAVFYFDRTNTNNVFKIQPLAISGTTVSSNLQGSFSGLNGLVDDYQNISVAKLDEGRIAFAYLPTTRVLQTGVVSFSGTTMSTGTITTIATDTAAEIKVNYWEGYSRVAFLYNTQVSSILGGNPQKKGHWGGNLRIRASGSNNLTSSGGELGTYWFEEPIKQTNPNSSWIFRRNSTNTERFVCNRLPRRVGTFLYPDSQNREEIFFGTWNTTNNGWMTYERAFNYQRSFNSFYSNAVELEKGKIASVSINEANFSWHLFIFEDFDTKYCEPAFTTPNGITNEAGTSGQTIGVFVNT